MVEEQAIIENKELRDQLVEKVEVLQKVKSLLLIPQTEIATVKQVAAFYEVGEEAVQSLYKDNKNELDEDGVSLKSYRDFLNVPEGQLKTGRGKSTLSYTNGYVLVIPNRGLKTFPRRAILRIGMLLRDSKIAAEVRTQLLNIEEKTTIEIKTQDINEEQSLAINIGMAHMAGNIDQFAKASQQYIAFQNRNITKLKDSNRALAQGELIWEDRSRINFAVRKLATATHTKYGIMWSELYKQLKNKYHIDLVSRGKQPWIQHVTEIEWTKVIKSFSALCEYYSVEPSDMFCDLELS